MALVIEATDESGPSGLPAISVAHYREQNGDLMRDPEMCFELGFADQCKLYRNVRWLLARVTGEGASYDSISVKQADANTVSYEAKNSKTIISPADES